ncbi:uncharacterized protein LOC128736621 [Sabethes cyaneus]|uniref:uncharacterized protein LOC128736621 n=1 Tax=Sabethes cyaneus TaxID=53552 RepID=UPI00237D484E|nr:uncharacterized protein LOC128736621 [Sabethes cyaneus]
MMHTTKRFRSPPRARAACPVNYASSNTIGAIALRFPYVMLNEISVPNPVASGSWVVETICKMSDKRQFPRCFAVAIVILQLVLGQTNSAKVDKVVVVMPKGPRTLQMLGSISPQLLHTISDVLKPVPSNVVQIPVPYYPDGHRYHKNNKYKNGGFSKQLHHAYFKNPFKAKPVVHFDIKHTQPGPYDTPFTPVLKPSPVSPLHVEKAPEIKFTPINLLPPEPPSFDTVRNYVQMLKQKQKAFFDNQGYEYGLSVVPPPTKYSDYLKKKKYPHKYSKPSYEYLFNSHPNELSHVGHGNQVNQVEENVYYTESDDNLHYHSQGNHAEGHEYVIPPDNEFHTAIPLVGFVDSEDAHFEQKGEDLVLKTKHPHAAVITPEELEYFTHHYPNEHVFSEKPDQKSKNNIESEDPGNAVHRREKRYKNERTGRASGNQDEEADFYDSDESKKSLGDDDFYDIEEVKAHANFEPRKTYTQVRHENTNRKENNESGPGPRVREKVTVSKTNIVYSEKGREDDRFDHAEEESSGAFSSKSKTPKKYRSKRDVSEQIATTEAPVETRAVEGQQSEDFFDEPSSQENEIEYELRPEQDDGENQNDTDAILLPYAQALVLQNGTDMILLPLPEALVDPRELQGEELLNFLDEAIQNSTKFLPKEKKKKRIEVSPDIKKLHGEELIQFLDDAIKTSNQYLISERSDTGSGDAIELIKGPRLGEEQATAKTQRRVDHVIEFGADSPRAEQVRGDFLQHNGNHRLPDVPQYETVRFIRPFSTLLKLQEAAAPDDDYEIEIEPQNPKDLHGQDLIQYLEEAIDNTTHLIPASYDSQSYTTPYMDRAFHYVDVDTALKIADNVTSQISEYLNKRKKLNEIDSQPAEEHLAISDGGFVPVRRSDVVKLNPHFKPDFVGIPKDAYKDSQQKQLNPAVVVYNDVIRHIKNHLSSSKASKTNDRNMIMIAVPRSLESKNSQEAQRRGDYGLESIRSSTMFSLPIFDITKFYPSSSLAYESFDDDDDDDEGKEYKVPNKMKIIIEKEAERAVEKATKYSSKGPTTPSTKAYIRDDIEDAFKDVPYTIPPPNQIIPIKPYSVKEKLRDAPQPTFKKPGPPYAALPLPPVSTSTKVASLNTVSKHRKANHNHGSPPHPPAKRKRPSKHRSHSVKRIVPIVRKRVRIVKH